MSEIRLDVDDRYPQPLLGFLKTLNYVQINKVSKSSTQLEKIDSTTVLHDTSTVDDPLLLALKTPSLVADVEAVLLNKDYQGTDLVKLSQFAAELDIPNLRKN